MSGSKINTVGFVGLGSMGAHMARRLLEAGHEVCVLDVRTEAVEAAVRLGATAATSPRDLGDRSEVVCLSLPRPTDVHEVVVEGADALAKGSRFHTYIDLSTSGPEMAATVAAELGAGGRAVLDAPVSGGPRGARDGTVCIMVSGDRAAYDACAGLLGVLGGEVVFLGDRPGQAQTMKVINNTISASCLAASSEGLVLGAKAGLDADAMVRVLNASSARNTHTEDKLPRCVLPGSFDFGFQLALMLKDVRLCMGLAEELEVPMLVSGSVAQLYMLAVARGGTDQDISMLIQQVEEWAGAQVRSGVPAVSSGSVGEDEAVTA